MNNNQPGRSGWRYRSKKTDKVLITTKTEWWLYGDSRYHCLLCAYVWYFPLKNKNKNPDYESYWQGSIWGNCRIKSKQSRTESNEKSKQNTRKRRKEEHKLSNLREQSSIFSNTIRKQQKVPLKPKPIFNQSSF